MTERSLSTPYNTHNSIINNYAFQNSRLSRPLNEYGRTTSSNKLSQHNCGFLSARAISPIFTAPGYPESALQKIRSTKPDTSKRSGTPSTLLYWVKTSDCSLLTAIIFSGKRRIDETKNMQKLCLASVHGK